MSITINKSTAYKAAVATVDALDEEFFFSNATTARREHIQDVLLPVAKMRERLAGVLLCPAGEPDNHVMGYCPCHMCPECSFWYDAPEGFECQCPR